MPFKTQLFDLYPGVQKKLICNVLHYKLPCGACKGLIWTQQLPGSVHVCCDQCNNISKVGVGTRHPSTPKSDRQYNG